MNKKITVVCSNYNSDLWIDDYLKCTNNQIDKNFDIIFLDANSSDNSLSKIKNLKAEETYENESPEIELEEYKDEDE